MYRSHSCDNDIIIIIFYLAISSSARNALGASFLHGEGNSTGLQEILCCQKSQ